MSVLSSLLVERASPSGTFNGTPPDQLPAENGIHIWRAAVAMPFVTFVFVALRFYTRTYLLRAKKYTIDDCMLSLHHENSIIVLTNDRYCGVQYAGVHSPRCANGDRNVQRHGASYMAVRLGAEFALLSLDWDHVRIICARLVRL